MKMKVKHYFYSGRSQLHNGIVAYFSGVFTAKAETQSWDVYNDIISKYEVQTSGDVNLTALNIIGDGDE